MSDTSNSDGLAFEDGSTSSPAKPPRRWNWTMIGMMASIIVLCAGILTPIVHQMREKARRAHCLCNMSQLGLSMRLYTGDYGQRFPTDAAETTLGSLALLTNNYCTSMRTFMCPTDTDGLGGCGSGGRSKAPNPFLSRKLSYAYNAFGLTEQVQPDTPILADRTSGDIRSVAPYVSNVWTHKSDGGNVNYADGHTEFRRILAPPLYRGKNP